MIGIPLALGSLIATSVLSPTSPQEESGGSPGARVLGVSTAGSAGRPRLTMHGAPLAGRPFALRVEDGLPGALGWLFYSTQLTPVFVPSVGATLYPGAPLGSRAFALDVRGSSGDVVALANVPLSLQGVAFHAQAGILDPAATGGIATTYGATFEFGAAPFGSDVPRRRHVAHEDVIGAVGRDLDGDGIGDLIVACTDSQSGFDVFLGEGEGEFAPRVEYLVGNQLAWFDVADVNGDGNDDFVGVSRVGAGLHVVLGAGDGTFGAATTYTTTMLSPDYGGLGDVNGDGVLDALTSTLNGDQLDVRLGVGDGTLLAPTTYTIVGMRQFTLADLDGDGDDDVIAAAGEIEIHLAGPGGVLTPGATIKPARKAATATIADVNGDAYPDLFTTTTIGDAVVYWEGAPGPTFVFGRGFELNDPSIRGAIDVTRDGSVDLVVLDSVNVLSVFPGDGNGTFGPAVTTAGPSYNTSLADADGDGYVDAVSNGNRAILVHRGTGGGRFEEDARAPIDDAYQVALADADGDGNVDVVGPARGAAELVVAFGNGDGTTGDVLHLPTQLTPEDVIVSDLNLDDRPDLVCLNFSGQSFSVFVGLGGRAFQGMPDIPINWARRATSGDWNGDGFPDLVALENGALMTVHPGNGDGTFGAPLPFVMPAIGADVLLQDVDGDGFDDLVVALGTANVIHVYFNAGNGTIAKQVTLPTSGSAAGVTLGDFDGDGELDVAAAVGAVGVEVRRGLGGRTFAAPVASGGVNPSAIVSADFDADRRLDVAVIETSPGLLHVLHGRGDATFDAPITTTSGGWPLGLAVGDLNRDLLPDIAIANSNSPSVSLVLDVLAPKRP